MGKTPMPTLWFSDIQGSTSLLQRVGPLYAELLSRHRQIVRFAIATFSGTERGTEGDSFFVTFDAPTNAIAASVEVQRAHQVEPWPSGAEISVRIGVHTGEASDTSAGLVGLAIHHAARIASAAHGGQIIVSGPARAAVADLPEAIGMRSLGVHQLRDVGEMALFQVTHSDLASHFPPPRTQGAARNNLPAALSSLIGRTSELVTIAELLGKHRVVTLTGAGGSGKTRLALQAASEAGVHFADGVWFVDLAALSDGDRVMGVVGEAIGARGASEQVIDGLRGRAMLLVFDNCEHLLDVCGSVISQLMAVSPKSAVLATSREPLGLAGEAVFRVPSLSLPSAGGGTADLLQSDAGRLFVERAALVRPGFAPTDDDAAAITEICTRLDGIPLAIELAAARVRMLGPADIAHRLDDRFRLLTGGSRSALPRQQTLQATVDWSFRLLSPAEQTMLTRLAVFQGGCDLQSAERVCADDGMDALDVLDVVSSLQDKSLVIEIDSAVQRFRMTETIRQYASERLLDTTDVEALRDRHAHHFAGRTNAAIANSVAHAFSDLTQLCHADADNLRAAATWLLQREPAAALHLLCELNIAAMFWHDMAWVATLTPLALEQAVDASVDMRAVGHVNVAGSALFGYVDADVRQHQVAARSLLDSMQDRGDFGYVLAMLNFQSSATARRGMDRDAARLAMQAADEGGSVIRRFAVGMITLLLAPFTVAEPIIASFIDDARRLSEPLLEQQWSLEMAVHLGFAGRSEAGLIMLRAGLLDLDHLTSNGDAFQSALFAAILEGEHGDVAIGTNLAADLAERLERRPHDPCEETMARAAVARLAVLSGDFETAERVAARAADRMRDGQPPSFLTSLVDVTLSQCLRRRGELDQAARALGRDLNGTATGSTDIWLRMLEEAALLFHAFGRTSNAADLLATATVGRLEVGKPLAPAGRADLDHLRADLGAVPGVVLDNAAAARLIESLAVD